MMPPPYFIRTPEDHTWLAALTIDHVGWTIDPDAALRFPSYMQAHVAAIRLSERYGPVGYYHTEIIDAAGDVLATL